jgi:serine/threonine-protein kinase HipA
MPRRRTRIPLNVYLNGRLVGRLRRETSGAIDFQYDAGWLAWEDALPVSLALPLREDRFIGAPVVAVFDNLLPDDDEIRHRLAQCAQAEGDDAYSLLAAVGRDCAGALQFLPDGQDPGPAGRVEGRAIDEAEIAAILADLRERPLGVGAEREFRISIAGAQQKTALLYWQDRWHLPHGTAATTHILKPQIGKLPNGLDLSQSVENEHFCMKLTAALGLPTARAEIHDFAGRRALVIERFDRLWTRDNRLLRLPQEDCLQALSLPSTRKYESDGGPGIKDILELLRGSDEPDADQRVFLKAQIVFWLLGATDGHAKNFSIHLLPGGRFRLTPLYDGMSAQPGRDAGQMTKNQMRFAMAVGDSRHYVMDAIMPRHFQETARASGVAPAVVEDILAELAREVPGALARVAAELPAGFPATITDSIAEGIRRRLRLAAHVAG